MRRGVELRLEVEPASVWRIPPHTGRDAVARRRPGTVRRLMHVGGRPVHAAAAEGASGRAVLAVHAPDRDAADEGLRRLRHMLGVDDDLGPFVAAHRHDPLIGASVRRWPWLRPGRRPEPFEALAWAVCEQLIAFERAAEIERRLVVRHGPRCPRTGLRDVPSAATFAGLAPAQIEAAGLAHSRALALRRAAREVAAGRIDLADGDHERSWRLLRRIPGIGRWTVDCLALHGQGRNDVVPAADLGFLKIVGRLLGRGPHGLAEEDEVRAVLDRYAPWAGLAGTHLVRAAARGLLPAALPEGAGRRDDAAPRPWPRAQREPAGRSAVVSAPRPSGSPSSNPRSAIQAA